VESWLLNDANVANLSELARRLDWEPTKLLNLIVAVEVAKLLEMAADENITSDPKIRAEQPAQTS
jgi:hypothetical protein